eukprot:TRINITY_DN2581_c0_g2_i2.p1 TRINITY_DN2581_c0_g2~~TRINITY_DN2581_c0_g2_i2.p1  ORF type:complete len:731 (-),score=164.80 TRINITY_DN2581_c0_g2_i2:675-2576(-)
MKEKVRQNLSKPKVYVTDFYKEYGICQKVARSPIFDKMTLTVIALNAMWIAVDTDYNSSSLLLEAAPAFVIAENFFCAYFLFEWFARYMSFRRKTDSLKNAWFVFDTFMVTMMVLETWMFTIVTLMMADNSGGGNSGVLRVARLLRLSRMARMARLLRAMPELMIMIKGMMAATRSVFFTLCLLFTFMYIFGIAFTQLAEGFAVGKQHFNSVPGSIYTLLVYGTLLDNVGALLLQLSDEPFYLSALFFIYVLIGSLTVMNMLVGVLCEVVSAVAATEQEEMLVTHVNDRLSRVMAMLDQDGGGSISKKEFAGILDNVDAVRCLNDVGVDVMALVDLADYIFEADDTDDEVELDFSRFMDVVLQLRGTNVATVKDIVDIRKFIRQTAMDSNKQMVDLQNMMRDIMHMRPQENYRASKAKTASTSAGAAPAKTSATLSPPPSLPPPKILEPEPDSAPSLPLLAGQAVAVDTRFDAFDLDMSWRIPMEEEPREFHAAASCPIIRPLESNGFESSLLSGVGKPLLTGKEARDTSQITIDLHGEAVRSLEAMQFQLDEMCFKHKASLDELRSRLNGVGSEASNHKHGSSLGVRPHDCGPAPAAAPGNAAIRLQSGDNGVRREAVQVAENRNQPPANAL